MPDAQGVENGGPTTDCAVCDRPAKECDDSHAKGWDGCCMGCDGAGRTNAHRLRMTRVIPPGESAPDASEAEGRG